MFCGCFGGKDLPLDTQADIGEKIKPVISDASSGVKAGIDTLPTSTDVSSLADTDPRAGAAVVLHAVEDSSKAAFGTMKTRDIKPPTSNRVVETGARDATFQQMGVQLTASGPSDVAPVEEEGIEVQVFKEMGVDMVTAGTSPAPSRDELFQTMAVNNTTMAKSKASPEVTDELFKNIGIESIVKPSTADSLFKDMGTQLVIGGTAPKPTVDQVFQGMALDLMTKGPVKEVAAVPSKPDVFQNMGVSFTTGSFVPLPAQPPIPDSVEDKTFKHMGVEISTREPLRPLPNHPPVQPEVAVPAPEPVRPAPSPRDDAFFQHIAGDLTSGVATELDLEAATRAPAGQKPADPFWADESVALTVGGIVRKKSGFTLPQEEESAGGMSFFQKAVGLVHDVVDAGQKSLTAQDSAPGKA
ncbi:hypothetical protein BSKO_04931 [Bryopsis sp. KO-2023]|nr:hypothetical protein BSKO_04931 [Bryopsis sp. KO-2023]